MSTAKSRSVDSEAILAKASPEIELRPHADEIPIFTDTYFNKTRDIVCKFGDTPVTYAVFMRRPVISATRLALDWLESIAAAAQ